MKPQLNLNKAALYSIVINALQIVAAVALAVLILMEDYNPSLRGPVGNIIVITLATVVSWGAFMDIREAVRARKMGFKLQGLDETVSQMTDLNHALRAQRHDFLNHLQVVYSLIEMGEYSEANRYIAQVYGDIQQVSRTLKTACAPAGLFLRKCWKHSQARKISVTMKYGLYPSAPRARDARNEMTATESSMKPSGRSIAVRHPVIMSFFFLKPFSSFLAAFLTTAI